MANVKVSALPLDNAPTGDDYILTVDGTATKKAVLNTLPISVATQSALDGKAPTHSHPYLSNAATTDGYVWVYRSASGWTTEALPSSTLPSQVGQSGKFLTTDGTTTLWATAPSNGAFTVVKHTVDNQVMVVGVANVITIIGASTHTLPPANSLGDKLYIYKETTGSITLNADGLDKIVDSAAGGSISNTSAYGWGCLKLICLIIGKWSIDGAPLGEWTT